MDLRKFASIVLVPVLCLTWTLAGSATAVGQGGPPSGGWQGRGGGPGGGGWQGRGSRGGDSRGGDTQGGRGGWQGRGGGRSGGESQGGRGGWQGRGGDRSGGDQGGSDRGRGSWGGRSRGGDDNQNRGSWGGRSRGGDDNSRGRGRGRDGDDGDRNRGRGDRENREDRSNEPKGLEIPDLITQLKALDANKNSRLDPLEANRVSIAVFERFGLDSTQSIGYSSLSTVLGDVELEDLELKGLSEEAGVPEFEDLWMQRDPPKEFEPSKVSVLTDKRPLQERYSADVLNQLASMLNQFDTNNDLALDSKEMSVIPWGSPAPSESDLDSNGVLTEIELAERIAARSDNGFVSSKSSEKKAKESSRNPEDDSPREEETSRSRPKPKLSEQDRTAKYVKELISKYDKNGDNAMDADEIKEMRSPPKSESDLDGDGTLTFEELYTHYSGGKKPSSGVTASSEVPGTVYWDALLPESSGRSRSSGDDRGGVGYSPKGIRYGNQ